MSNQAPNKARGQAPDEARVIPLRPQPPELPPRGRGVPAPRPAAAPPGSATTAPRRPGPAGSPAREPLWRDLVGEVLRRERQAQERTLKDVADTARISMPYLSEVERGRKEASSEVLAAAAHALGLSLADLLARAQGELLRVTARHGAPARRRAAAPPSHGGLCLAA
ncbi:helix-turn-helix transcriptional regulator [Streptomyces sp. NPDC052682]|uniref:helix-turn-helix domain-containing protein n=1 Tax=Streptomyces sp. NPDC052682 TaxID=3154954 RepID=UPI00341856C4